MKRKIEGKYYFDSIRGIKTDIYNLPCGRCTSCKIQIAKEWALRCALELPYWEKSIFTTLTFNNENNIDPSIHKAEFQKFVNDLRNDCRKDNRKIKILGAGEYGNNSMRKHYHAIIYGIGTEDEKHYIGTDETYTSEKGLIEENWLKGNVFNGFVTYNSARYVASYVFKKYYDDLEEQVYKSIGLETPFQYTSGGLGKSYYNEWKNNIVNRGYIMFNGVKHNIPRYFLRLYEKEAHNMWENNKYEKKLKEIQIANQERKFQEWYEDYIRKLTKKLCEDPDTYNYNRLNEAGCEDFKRFFVGRYIQWQDKQNEAKANLAEARNRLF